MAADVDDHGGADPAPEADIVNNVQNDLPERERGSDLRRFALRNGDFLVARRRGKRRTGHVPEVEPRAEKLVVRVGGGYNTLREFLDLSARPCVLGEAERTDHSTPWCISRQSRVYPITN